MEITNLNRFSLIARFLVVIFFFFQTELMHKMLKKRQGGVNTSFVSLRLPHDSHLEKRQEVIESIGAGRLLKTL